MAICLCDRSLQRYGTLGGRIKSSIATMQVRHHTQVQGGHWMDGPVLRPTAHLCILFCIQLSYCHRFLRRVDGSSFLLHPRHRHVRLHAVRSRVLQEHVLLYSFLSSGVLARPRVHVVVDGKRVWMWFARATHGGKKDTSHGWTTTVGRCSWTWDETTWPWTMA